ncbi:hypothetical protein C7974DRAFT_118002 [Boeremia exigua]|uniref:uncharacterized protein n=1 Tax=Boeremia exigua TaxID=749465 RepID=UPI001E8CD612|nr:uncharacterized protein C7974DRAFT_118002 [Boeremia exigua]KAH6643141.1 hypothetical protein C7974DRAFT_118002 [Boeremia exigua]
MQNQQMQMAMNNGGPVNGTPVMAHLSMPGPPQHQAMDPREQLNTYIYDYFLRNNHNRLARAMVECDMKMSTTPAQKTSPGSKPNGLDPDDDTHGLPNPLLPKNQMADNSFLLDWWVQFWDIFQASKIRSGQPTKGAQYIQHTRHITQMQNEQRNQRMMMSNPMNAQYQAVGSMMRANMPNGVAPNDLKRAALQNNRPNGNPMAMGQMGKPQMAAQMQRDGSQMDMNGQRAPSPANDSAPSPNKRPRVDGGLNMPGAPFNDFGQPANNAQQKNMEVYSQGLAQVHRVALNNTASPQAMTQGSPMNQGMDGADMMFANQPRPGMPPQQPGQPQQGSHALQDYQMQLMLLEQQNKKRLLMARQEQDNISQPHPQPGGFPPVMSPSGSRQGPSPNPADMKGRTPKLGQQGLPGSPMPEGAMQQRASPAPNMNFPDPNLAPPGMPPQFYPQMPNNPMMRPPSSHPAANFNGQQMTPQQMEAMRAGQMNGQMNGQWRGQPGPGMPQQPQMMGGPMQGGPQQRGQMPPPPAPANEQRPEASPAMSNQAPPTPNQGNKAAPKKKGAKDNKKPAPKKGPNAGTTPAASAGEEAPTPTPNTPITPMHAKSFNPNGQPQPQPPQPPPAAPMANDAPFGDLTENSFDIGLNFGDGDTALENFDFDSFLHTGEDSSGFGSLVGFDDFTNGVEAGDGI